MTMADGDEDELMDEHTEENNENEEVDQLADEDDTIAMGKKKKNTRKPTNKAK